MYILGANMYSLGANMDI